MGAQGQRVGTAGVGRQDLINQGVIDAIDLWGYITPGIEVCFAAQGRLVFLDAAYAPRQLLDLPAYRRNGQTCTTVDRAGTIVLLTGKPIYVECELETLATLNLRAVPVDGLIIGLVPEGQSLRSSERREGYYRVSLAGSEGWVSGDYVRVAGGC